MNSNCSCASYTSPSPLPTHFPLGSWLRQHLASFPVCLSSFSHSPRLSMWPVWRQFWGASVGLVLSYFPLPQSSTYSNSNSDWLCHWPISFGYFYPAPTPPTVAAAARATTERVLGPFAFVAETNFQLFASISILRLMKWHKSIKTRLGTNRNWPKTVFWQLQY